MKERNIQPPIPDNVEDLLTPLQLGTIKRLETFGWHLWFVRRPLFQDKVVILKHIDTGETMYIGFEGEAERNHDITIRD